MGRKGGRRIKGKVNMSREKIGRVVRQLKDGKAMGVDGIPNEVWKYDGKEIKEWMWGICGGMVWKGKR